MLPNKYLICDIETTSKDICSAEIITASFIKCDKRLNVIDHQNFKMAPTYWTLHHDEATQIHGIDRKTAFSFPEKQGELKRLVEWIQDGPYHFTCHANRQNKSGWVTFDYAVLKQELFDMNLHYELYRMCPTQFICSTHSLAKNLDRNGKIHIPLRVRDGNKKASKSFRLNELCKLFNIELNHHDAESDSWACLKLLVHFSKLTDIVSVIENDWRNLWDQETKESSISSSF